jgi:hypothetical protein
VKGKKEGKEGVRRYNDQIMYAFSMAQFGFLLDILSILKTVL